MKMKKVNFEFNGVKQEKKEFQMGGITVTAVNKIPYAQKVECAKFMATRSIVEDDLNPGNVLHSIHTDMVDMQAYLMFYTNANVEGMSIDAMREVFDNLHDDEGYYELTDFICKDVAVVKGMLYTMIDDVVQQIEASRKKETGFERILEAFMADPNPEATITRNRELNEQLIDALKIVRQGE